MTRLGNGETAVGVWEDNTRIRELVHLRHKSKILDWTRATGPGGGHAASDLARSIVGDLLGVANPTPVTYREVTLQLARIPRGGGELTEHDILGLIGGLS